ncbi:hypothetical protein GUITHDRAFT_106995 [Guillardia theta CCMP2712]|uniref:Amidohydrolase-related domain-containing protein n=1 Tax=Guillardia theta (strain CCMP2712) TaxID=905079 RepID=L1JFI0_GUITC|nr:hypothetical protein GUITHDRAFT_106995 [Guillardia theta CCMP2712]EKX47082.1 hypothetical protein GUITHDRAFT_106995 [Guillardia theta CCMP2712]|eukprot:XP_005834062.1 hypothetical protein GUITHDRAFT_106995 [Guillardia theta CCMP2712]
MSIVDSAVHVWKQDRNYPWATPNPPAADASAEELIALMDANGVDKTVLVQPICYLWDNSYVRDCMRRFPGRFAAVARVNPEDDASVEKLEELSKEGFIGVRFGPLDRGWWESERMRNILKKAEELKFPVLLFLGKDGGKSLQWVAPRIKEFPNVKFIVDHMADVPPSDDQQIDELLSLASSPNVLVKISHVWAISTGQYPWSDAIRDEVVRRFGPDRCMFASDWPVCKMPTWPGGNTSYDMTVKLAKEEYKFLTEDELAWILGGTASSIWFPASGTHG